MDNTKKPSPRRQIPLCDVEKAYRREGVGELSIAVRDIRIQPPGGCDILAPYHEDIRPPASKCNQPVYLFHGCGNIISPEVISSFVRWGPSIRFSRPQGYLSSSPAVYWTNSIEFAVAWSFFSEHGHWGMDGTAISPSTPFRCLVSVARLNLSQTTFEGGLYLIPTPDTPEQEEELHKETMKSFRTTRGEGESTWIFAARNEAAGRAIGEETIEILNMVFESPPNWELTGSKIVIGQ